VPPTIGIFFTLPAGWIQNLVLPTIWFSNPKSQINNVIEGTKEIIFIKEVK
jgi:hypothetical protein